jgi:hypothetical protein
MNSTLILFKEIGRQLLIVGLVLGSLPMAIRILWKLRLLPLGCYFVATKLFWPRWAAAHRTACILIFIACVLFFVLCWTIRYIRQKREEQIMAELIHHYTKDLKPGESRTLEFLRTDIKNCVPSRDAILLCAEHFMYQPVRPLDKPGQHQHIEHELSEVLPDHRDGGQRFVQRRTSTR